MCFPLVHVKSFFLLLLSRFLLFFLMANICGWCIYIHLYDLFGLLGFLDRWIFLIQFRTLQSYNFFRCFFCSFLSVFTFTQILSHAFSLLDGVLQVLGLFVFFRLSLTLLFSFLVISIDFIFRFTGFCFKAKYVM